MEMRHSPFVARAPRRRTSQKPDTPLGVLAVGCFLGAFILFVLAI